MFPYLSLSRTRGPATVVSRVLSGFGCTMALGWITERYTATVSDNVAPGDRPSILHRPNGAGLSLDCNSSSTLVVRNSTLGSSSSIRSSHTGNCLRAMIVKASTISLFILSPTSWRRPGFADYPSPLLVASFLRQLIDQADGHNTGAWASHRKSRPVEGPFYRPTECE